MRRGKLVMSETMTREMNGAVQNVRRATSHSVALLRAATGLSNGLQNSTLAAANDPDVEPMPLPAPPSTISANTEIIGEITTTDELLVHGRVKGDIRATAVS